MRRVQNTLVSIGVGLICTFVAAFITLIVLGFISYYNNSLSFPPQTVPYFVIISSASFTVSFLVNFINNEFNLGLYRWLGLSRDSLSTEPNPTAGTIPTYDPLPGVSSSVAPAEPPKTLEERYEAVRSVATKKEKDKMAGFIDPISQGVMETPVLLNTGKNVDKLTADRLIRKGELCPITKDPVENYVPNPEKRGDALTLIEKLEKKAKDNNSEVVIKVDEQFAADEYSNPTTASTSLLVKRPDKPPSVDSKLEEPNPDDALDEQTPLIPS